jgi:cell division septation protein DedD
VLAAAAGVWATRQSLGRWWGRPSSVVTPTVEAKAPPAASVAAASREVPVVQPAPKVALQMATFQSSARAQQALEQLRNAGYRAYMVELAPQNGDRMLTVFVGPYSDASDAERDLDAARLIPDYATARVVQLMPGLLPSDPRQ